MEERVKELIENNDWRTAVAELAAAVDALNAQVLPKSEPAATDAPQS